MKLEKPITFKNINQKPYGEKLFQRKTLTLQDKVTVFVGPNGYGKSTLMGCLKQSLEKQGVQKISKHLRSQRIEKAFKVLGDHPDDNISKTIAYMSYDAHADDYHNTLSANLTDGQLEMFNLRKESSEGQNKLFSLMELFDAARLVARKSHLEQLILFVDGIDSGLSVDMINLIMSTLELKLGQIEQWGVEVALILTTNNYDMCQNVTVLDPLTFKPLTYETYDDFRKDMIDKSRL